MKEIIVPAKIEELANIQGLIESDLEDYECGMKSMMQVSIAVEEIFVNIASYAYGTEDGVTKILYEFREEPSRIYMEFHDTGKKFNPLEKEDTDTSLPIEDKQIGGLGILMVKKSMDVMEYLYEKSTNILMIEKNLD